MIGHFILICFVLFLGSVCDALKPIIPTCNGVRYAVLDPCPPPCPPTCAVVKPLPTKECTQPCKGSGCVCWSGYILSEPNGKCILADNCPGGNPCGVNGTYVACVETCQDEYCPIDDSPVSSECSVGNCVPGCMCKGGYKRLQSEVFTCVLPSDCPPLPCSSPCTPTCANPNPKCESQPDPPCCDNGYILSAKGGKCIKPEECPTDLGCNGDPNAVIKRCPKPCPSTCDRPNEFLCRLKCVDIGCECKRGYLLNKEGKCVYPQECPGGNPCRKNEVFVSCKSNCPKDYCPTSDSRKEVNCTLPYDCLSGCQCAINYRRKSRKNDQCIFSRTCPPVKCTRPNEVWAPCPNICSEEDCEFVDKPRRVCRSLNINCDPRCVCKKHYYRSPSGICVSAAECRRINSEDSDCDDDADE